ncbi:uncharacterized protein LOC133184651 [Saccostrea echinata]|uniref:uncharacterized protein LOC133184651 n=1 Tax=Saccostrea echinata TaxID=191078 RepID=UPI002A7FE075|nr:uncharacterized protein LOC133184651 [Saccostrea echinata]
MKWWTFIIVLAIVISLTSARGRGGGARGSYRGSSRSSSSRSYRSAFSGNRLSSSSSIRSALLLGTVYGATRYRMRARYRSDGTLPEICYNDSYNMSTNGTVSYQGRFVCPLEESMSEDYRYCCGEEGKQYCCTFWENPGHIVGVVFGVLAAAVALFFGVFCIIKYMQSKKSRKASAYKSSGHENLPTYSPPSYEMANSNQKSPYPIDNGGYSYGGDINGYTQSTPYPPTNGTQPTPYPPSNGYPASPPYPTADNPWGQKY